MQAFSAVSETSSLNQKSLGWLVKGGIHEARLLLHGRRRSLILRGDSNKKLSQDNAEKAIKAFASTNPMVGPRGFGDCSLNVQSIARIEPLSQFSDTEATSLVTLKCESGTMHFKFVFQKDIDNQWFLTKIISVEGNVATRENLKVPAR